MRAKAMPGLVERTRAHIASREGLSAAAEVILMALVLFVFTRLHAACGRAGATAIANAHAVASIERVLRVDRELAMNRWLNEHGPLIPAAVLLYRGYYVVLLSVVVWVFLRRRDIYLHVRRTFVAMTGLALLVFWVLPVAPPRFSLPGVVDIVGEHDVLHNHSSHDLSNGANFTAMPSLHVGWSAWCAYAFWSGHRGRHPRAALLAWLFPLIMVGDVLATGNHYVLDVVGSAVLLIASIAVATGWSRLFDSRSRAIRRILGRGPAQNLKGP